jgi:hypothetical protein
MRIRDPLHLEEVQVSPSLIGEVSATGEFDLEEEVLPLFDEDGRLAPW